MHSLVLLVVSQDGDQQSQQHRSVRFLLGRNSFLQVGSSRVSALLTIGQPLTDDCEALCLSDGRAIGFYFHAKPALAANLILRHYADAIAAGELFAGLSLGRASIVISAKSPELLEEIFRLITRDRANDCPGYEWWNVHSNQLHGAKQEHLGSIAHYATILGDVASLPDEHFESLVECQLSLSTVISHANKYTHETARSFRALENDLTLARLTVVKHHRGKNKQNHTTLRRTQTNLTEILASLSFVDSQWFSGISRILAHPGQIRDHSLLGVGTACLGLANTLEKAVSLFNESQVIEQFEGLLEADRFDPYALGNERNKFWADLSLSTVSRRGAGKGKVVIPLVHFSARRGWRETDYSLSAPETTLRQGGSSYWHIRNITHELLHSHVITLIGSLQGYIVRKLKRGVFNQSGTRITNEFVVPEILACEGGQLLYEDGTSAVDAGVSLWTAFCHAGVMMQKAEAFVSNFKKPSGKDQLDFQHDDRIEVSQLRSERSIQLHNEEINEIIVQVLDFFYFYGANRDEYVNGIWLAWSRVPTVHRHVAHYVRRLVCTLLSTEDFPTVPQIEDCAKWLTRKLRKKELSQNALSKQALELLNSEEWQEREVIRISHRLHLVSIAKRFFYSSTISSDTLDDYFVGKEGGYTLAPFTYSIRGIGNPFAFLRHMQTTHTDGSRELTIWIFAQLASASINAPEVSDAVL